MIFLDSKYIGLISARLDKIKKVKPIYIISDVHIAETRRSIRTRREDIYIKEKLISTSSVTTVAFPSPLHTSSKI